MVSIFINPRQFNNADDLLKYPKSILKDLKLLENAGVDAAYIPVYSDIYEGENTKALDLSPIDSVLEGSFRPGHFNGVVDVLRQLFEIVKPTDVFFGLKDLQQCMVVEKLITAEFPGIEQQNCPTFREDSGLAMSSRNTRLSESGKIKAASIFKYLTFLASDAAKFYENRKLAESELNFAGIETEYLQLISLPDMQPMELYHKGERAAIVFAGYLEGIRLIDNVIL